MLIDRNSRNRCIIFLYYDKDGLVDRYVTGLLDALKSVSSYVLVVVNGYVTGEGEAALKSHSDSVLVRVNTGFDVGGYREGLFWIGFERLSTYDELVLMNYTFFAPLFPLPEMFGEMSGRDLDFWGITKHHDVPTDTTGGRIRYGHIPEHLNSHFLALRRDFFLSYSYRDFIINMSDPISYEASINEYEAIFTRHFADLGYKWDVYSNTDAFEGVVYAPFMFEGGELIEKRCPIIKRRLFFGDYFSLLANSAGESYSDACRAVRELTDYDMSMIWDNLLRLQDLFAVRYAIHESYVVDSEVSKGKISANEACVLVIGTKEQGDFLAGRYLRKIPGECDIYYSDGIPQTFEEFGRLFASPDLKKYRYVCVLKLPENAFEDMGSTFYGSAESLIGSAFQIENTVQIFRDNPELGLLVPPLPTFGRHFHEAEDGWHGRYEEVRAVADALGFTFPVLKGEMPPVWPAGGSYWAKVSVLREIYESHEVSDVLRREMRLPDGSPVRADPELVMLLLPYLFQSRKQMTGTVTGSHYASVQLTNLDYELRENNKVLFEKIRPGAWWEVLKKLDRIGEKV